jgi:hypothetical protein
MQKRFMESISGGKAASRSLLSEFVAIEGHVCWTIELDPLSPDSRQQARCDPNK